MIVIRKAGSRSWPISSGESEGRVSGGRLCGTSPTICTPLSASPKPQTASVVATTTATGPALATISAVPDLTPKLCSIGFSPKRTQNRKAIDRMPMVAVIQLMSLRFLASETSTSSRLCPAASMPRICLSWLAAMITPDAVMNPAITGCDRKLAINPSRKMPMPNSISPDSNASVSAAIA